MTETELTDPVLRHKRARLDTAKLVTSSIAAFAATAAVVVSMLALIQITTVTTTISDCTTPKGQCFQQQQKLQAENRARVVDSAVAAQLCGQTARTLDQMQVCVARTLKQVGDR